MPVLKIIWMSLLFCVAIYGGILWQLSTMWEKTEPRSLEELAASPVVLALSVAALTSIVLAFSIPNMLMQGRPLTPEVLRARSIVRWALIESVAIYGLLGAFVMQDLRVFIALGGVAILGFLLSFPSDERTLTPL